MIHISQDELLKQIEQEHARLFEPSSCHPAPASDSMSSSSSHLLYLPPPSSVYERLLADRNNNTNHNTSTTSNSNDIDIKNNIKNINLCIAQQHNNKLVADALSGPTPGAELAAGSAAQQDDAQAVLITGCGSKIGRNIAIAFARMGLKVALVDFDADQINSVASECERQSPRHREPVQIVADISQLDEAHKVIDKTIKHFGRLDVLVNTVNNASLVDAAKFNAAGDDDPHVFEQYHKIIASNMHAVTYLCISAAPYLRKSKGSIVNVSSITNNEQGSYKFAYCMSKAGISTLTKCLATDLAPDIKVICVSPKSDH